MDKYFYICLTLNPKLTNKNKFDPPSPLGPPYYPQKWFLVLLIKKMYVCSYNNYKTLSSNGDFL